MNNTDKIHKNIINVINSSMCNFYGEFGRQPNKILMSRDVLNFMVAYNRDLVCYALDETKTIMGMEIEIAYGKKGFIEVGYFSHNPCTVNLDYIEEE